MKRILVSGAGGFIGSHLVKRLKAEGHWVRGADLKYPEFSPTPADEFTIADLRYYSACMRVTEDMDEVYHLAADMGGIGYITRDHSGIATNNTLINLSMLRACAERKVGRFLFSSSACVYPQGMQSDSNVQPLRECDAWPAEPEEGYGLEKLYMEKLCQYYHEDLGLDIRIVRFHNVYGPEGTYQGGKEKAPAALCRKVAQARDGEEIEVWGDGEQTRSFLYIDDCVEGLLRTMAEGEAGPMNLGSDHLVSINTLVELIIRVAEKSITIRHDLTKPQGVRGRNSDNTKLVEVLQWWPTTLLSDGMLQTYKWIEAQVCSSKG